MSRDSRLLVLVVVVSGLTLALLARFRFPSEQRTVNPSPAPLERLAARATYDDLASIVAQLQTRIAESLVVVRVTRMRDTDPRVLADIFDGPESTMPVRLALAIRLPTGRLLAHMEPDERPQTIVGAATAPSMAAYDPLRQVALLAVTPADPSPANATVWEPTSPASTPRYVAVAEATQGGPAVRPLFIGRTDPFTDRRWNSSLLALGGAGVTQAGSFVFSLDGALEGLATAANGLPALAPMPALIAAADDLEHGRVPTGGDLGIDDADLTGPLAAATGASHGAIITFVRPDGPAGDALSVGDVITSFNGAPIDSMEELTLQTARSAPDTSATLGVIRRGAPTSVTVTVGVARPPAGGEEVRGDDIGLTLRLADATGAEVLTVRVDSPAAAAGISPRDLITSLDGSAAPTPAAVARAFKTAESGSYLLVGITRRGDHLVVAVRKP